ncbi:MAG: CAAX geranylgeranyltransferase alpha subunit [Cirrosporium novae-zelandiae]|nr:MAG: CAAX geranylgeranyltransferase alpha subunit [Cirrosporium novae-zelandiae]
MGKYSDSSAWEDVIPIPQDDGGPNPLAAIAYTEKYSEATSYLRAVMAANEMSERALELTEDIIKMNPAHYTVWLYRAKIVASIHRPVQEELEWLNAVSLEHLKNYQIWHHRHLLLASLPPPEPDNETSKILAAESPFLQEMLSKDAKNYHVWSYRQWLVGHFNLFDSPIEMKAVKESINEDVRNNSAWCHRYFLVFGRNDVDKGKGPLVAEQKDEFDPEIIEREIRYTKGKIMLAPQNASPWTYLRGICRRGGRPLSSLTSFALQLANPDLPDAVRSSWALDFVADAYAQEGKEPEKVKKALQLLAEKYDPVRKNYWEYRIGLLGDGTVQEA